MKVRINHIFLLALVVGWMACGVPCSARVLSLASASASSDDGTASAVASSDSCSKSSASASSFGGTASSSASASGGGCDESVVPSGRSLDSLIGLFEKIYGTLERRVQNGEDPKSAAERELKMQRMSIAGTWGGVLGAIGLRGRGAECNDKEKLAETQSDDFSQALIDGLVAAKGGLSVSAEEEIRTIIESRMGEAFKDAGEAACSINGFSLGARLDFAGALVEPVADAMVIAVQDQGVSFDRTTEPGNTDDEPEEEENDSINGSAIATTSVGGMPICDREFTICCLQRKVLSGRCDCLGGRCHATYEDGMWKDLSGLQCSCS